MDERSIQQGSSASDKQGVYWCLCNESHPRGEAREGLHLLQTQGKIRLALYPFSFNYFAMQSSQVFFREFIKLKRSFLKQQNLKHQEALSLPFPIFQLLFRSFLWIILFRGESPNQPHIVSSYSCLRSRLFSLGWMTSSCDLPFKENSAISMSLNS